MSSVAFLDGKWFTVDSLHAAKEWPSSLVVCDDSLVPSLRVIGEGPGLGIIVELEVDSIDGDVLTIPEDVGVYRDHEAGAQLPLVAASLRVLYNSARELHQLIGICIHWEREKFKKTKNTDPPPDPNIHILWQF